ncbi:MAG: hypothetical protein M2R45_00598 [Verrucomicrobia subdivision 3 bacterium]|nr:hypothetical protein [Limisphaerales bacterium]MCS1417813.1 hypothetical protein [Limisphaerales bacterium]
MSIEGRDKRDALEASGVLSVGKAVKDTKRYPQLGGPVPGSADTLVHVGSRCFGLKSRTGVSALLPDPHVFL